VTDTGWLETYRGTVFRWEVDLVDHFTVAYYFDRFEHAALGMLESIGLGPSYMRRERCACVTVDCYVRYLRELRAGDVIHVVSGVIHGDDTGVLLGHKLIDSATGAVCATLEQRAVHVAMGGRAPLALTTAQRSAADGRRVTWDGPPRERRPQPKGLHGFRDTARDTVKPTEIDVFGQSGLEFYVHRFSAANAQALAAFGMTPAYQRDEGRGFSTFEFQLELTGELHPGDAAQVKTALLHVGSSSLHLCHKLLSGRTGDVVATLHQLGVHLDMAARRPAPLPDALRERAKALLATSAGPPRGG
jgi:acyl-CoA thioesterase FadM